MIDKAAVKSYGWTDVEISLGFFETGQGVRFTVDPAVKGIILDRLLRENKRRFECDIPTTSKPKIKRPGSTTSPQIAFELVGHQGNDSHERERGGSALAIETFLRAHRSWLSKSDILAHVDIPDGQWNAAINDLLERGTVERKGERRGARYRISESD